jgi:hypothetical protein
MIQLATALEHTSPLHSEASALQHMSAPHSEAWLEHPAGISSVEASSGRPETCILQEDFAGETKLQLCCTLTNPGGVVGYGPMMALRYPQLCEPILVVHH